MHNNTNNNNNVYTENIFWLSDGLFGIMILLLSIFSFLWHATNAPFVHYMDLWSMDSSILYLLVRFACLTVLLVVSHYTTDTTTDTDTDTDNNNNSSYPRNSDTMMKSVAAWSCLLIYIMIVIGIGYFQYDLYQRQWLHGSYCPISGRARLSGLSNVFGQGHKHVYIGLDLCLFAVLPVLYIGIPMLVQIFWIESVGSVIACTTLFKTLVLGWSYRLTERWVLDNNPFMNWCNHGSNNYPTATKKTTITDLKRVVAAFTSPTAFLHVLTGLSLLTAYAHVRSVDEYLMVNAQQQESMY